jgi:eukaryotic-like serine/threonine-protein kinase
MGEQLTGTVIAEKYRVDSLLRSGEPGDFYRGRHLFMDKPVTLKILSPALAVDEYIRDLFTAGAKNSAAFAHPNILAVNDFGAGKDEGYYIVYEGFDGEPLSHAISRGGQFSVDRVLSTARQIAEALGAAHENGLVHGNLSPDSILVSYSQTGETVKVFDFEASAAEARRRADDRPSVNVAYLAPEQFSGLQNIDGRSDIYSLGIIIFQMLTGELPFKGETPMDVMLKHAEEPPPELKAFRPDCPATLGAAIQKALAKDPDERYQTIAELIEELDKIAVEAAAPSGNRFWKTAAIALAGIAILGAALIYATYTKQTIPTTQLQPDLNGVPVQPINPATGAEEQALVSVPGFLPGETGNTNMSQPPGTLPGGDSYNPWATGAPPPGAPLPNYVPPGGQYYSVDPNTGSPFMPPDSGVILVPVPANTDAAAKPTPTPKPASANANVQPTPPPDAAPKPTPAVKSSPGKTETPQTKPTPSRKPVQNKKPGSGEPPAGS